MANKMHKPQVANLKWDFTIVHDLYFQVAKVYTYTSRFWGENNVFGYQSAIVAVEDRFGENHKRQGSQGSY